MNVEKFFEEYTGVSVDKVRSIEVRYTVDDVCTFAHNYHENEIKKPEFFTEDYINADYARKISTENCSQLTFVLKKIDERAREGHFDVCIRTEDQLKDVEIKELEKRGFKIWEESLMPIYTISW